MPIIPGPNNQLITQSAAPVYGSTANYSQGTQGIQFLTSGGPFPKTIVSASITSYGNPILAICSGDVDPGYGGPASGSLQIYRDNTPIGQPVAFESSTQIITCAYSVSCIDAPPAGTYTYYLKANRLQPNSMFGTDSGPNLILMEIGRV